MKKALTALAAFVLTTAVAPAGATGFTIFGSGWNPDVTDEALGGGISLSFPFGDSGLGVDFRGSVPIDLDGAMVNLGIVWRF